MRTTLLELVVIALFACDQHGQVTSKRRSVSLVSVAGGILNLSHLVLPPWPEWSDADLNSEKWESGLGQGGKGKEKTKPAAASSLPGQMLVPDGFEDPTGHGELPSCLEVKEWKRPSEVYEKCELVNEQAHESGLDMVTTNLHILRSTLMREVIAGIMNLHHYGEIDPFQPEGEGSNFVPTGGFFWKPWHHVYGCCKAGKGQTHKPVVNPTGKYVVRLFFMGSWRRIFVDDYLPLDRHHRVLLPTTVDAELWPVLLAKALLKVARLTWREDQEVVDFNVAHCLTGWMWQELDCCNIPYTSVWQVCQKVLMADVEDITLRYGNPKENLEAERRTALEKHYSRLPQTETHFNKQAGMINIGTDAEHEVLGKVTVMGKLMDVDDEPEELAELGPCLGHSVLFSEARVFFLGEYGDGTPFPLWKIFRWRAWAIEREIIKDIKDIHMKSLRLFSPFKKISLPNYDIIDASSECLEVIDLDAENVVPLAGQGDGAKTSTVKIEKKTKGMDTKNSASKKSKASEGSKSSKGSKAKKSDGGKSSAKSSKSMKSASQTKDKSKSSKINQLKPNNDTWTDIYFLSKYLSAIDLFYRPSGFAFQQKITDVSLVNQQTLSQEKEKPAPGKKSSARDSSLPSQASRAQPVAANKGRPAQVIGNIYDCFYLFVDSTTCKKLFFTLSTVSPNGLEDEVMKLKAQNLAIKDSEEAQICERKDTWHSYVIGEHYQWESIGYGEPAFRLKTNGTNSVLVQLDEGMQVLRIWCKVPQCHFLQIASQVPFMIGSKDKVQETMSNMSESLNYYSEQMFTKFATLAINVSGESERNQNLQSFHNSYMPPCVQKLQTADNSDPECIEIQKLSMRVFNAFEEAAIRILCEKLGTNFDLFNVAFTSLQNFIQNDNYGFENLLRLAPSFASAIQTIRAEEENRLLEEAAATEQVSQSASKGKNKTGAAKKKQSDSSAKKKKSEGKSDLKTKGSKTKKGDTKVMSEVGSTASKMGKNKGKGEKGKGPKGGTVSHHILFETPSDSVSILKTMFVLEPDLLKYYPFRTDFGMKLVVSDFKGMAKVGSSQYWVPLVRYVVNMDGTELALNEIDLQSSLTPAILRIINNDTLEEIPRTAAVETKTYFQRNEFGYTIFAYGFYDAQSMVREYQWKLRFVADSKSKLLHNCKERGLSPDMCAIEPPPELTLQEVKGYYFPNRQSNIFRCLLTIPSEQNLSLHVSFNRPNIEYLLTIHYDETQEVAFGGKFKGNIVIPVILLFPAHNEEDAPVRTVFLVESQVANDSWVLSEDERSLATALKERAKTSMLIFRSEVKIGTLSKRSSKKSSLSAMGSVKSSTSKQQNVQELNPEAPQWTVQMVVGDDRGAEVVLELNRRRAEEVRRLKAAWERADPGRHKRAQGYREEYLLEMSDEDNELVNSAAELLRTPRQWVNLASGFLPKEVQSQPSLVDECRTMIKEYVVREQNRLEEQWDDFMQEYQRLTDKLANINSEQERKHKFIFAHYNKERELSSELMVEAYQPRDEYVRKELSKMEQEQAKTGKKDKKDKKKDKGKNGDKKSNKGDDKSSKKSKK